LDLARAFDLAQSAALVGLFFDSFTLFFTNIGEPDRSGFESFLRFLLTAFAISDLDNLDALSLERHFGFGSPPGTGSDYERGDLQRG
jgi:hypothetical protein